MTTEQKQILKRRLVEHITNIELKDLIDNCNEIKYMCNNKQINSDDFYKLIDEIKEKILYKL